MNDNHDNAPVIDGAAEELAGSADDDAAAGTPATTQPAVAARALAVAPVRPGAGLIAADDPREFLRKAQKVAEALVDVVRQQRFYVKIRGNDHPQVEAWQTLGALLGSFSDHGGVFPHTVWSRAQLDPATGQATLTRYTVKERRTRGQGATREVIEREYEVQGYDYEARVEARTASGLVVGAGEASCSRKESRWAQADDYAVKSMAQTRATSKALKAATGWLMVLAGYKPTPAEEMPDDEGQERAPAWAQPADGQLLDEARAAVRELGGPHAAPLARRITAACGQTLPRGLAHALVQIAAAQRARAHNGTNPATHGADRNANDPPGQPPDEHTPHDGPALEVADSNGYRPGTVRGLCELLYGTGDIDRLEPSELGGLSELLRTARAGGTSDEVLRRAVEQAGAHEDRETAGAALRRWLTERVQPDGAGTD